MAPQPGAFIVEDGVYITPVQSAPVPPPVPTPPAPPPPPQPPAPPPQPPPVSDLGGDVLVPPGLVHPVIPANTVGIPAPISQPVTSTDPGANTQPGAVDPTLPNFSDSVGDEPDDSEFAPPDYGQDFGDELYLDIFATSDPVPGPNYPGVTGPVTSGIWELERIIGRRHVHDDYATSGHAARSHHYHGQAVDFDWLPWIWDYLWPFRRNIAELLGPPGLYDNGVHWYDARIYAQHSGKNAHIHVAYLGTANQLDTLLGVRGNHGLPPGAAEPQPQPGQSPSGPAAVTPPQHLDTLDSVWHSVQRMVHFNWPAYAGSIEVAQRMLGDAVN